MLELVGDLHYPFLPVFVRAAGAVAATLRTLAPFFQAVTAGAYAICSCFFHVYDMAVDTTFLCFCESVSRYAWCGDNANRHCSVEDCELNDGSAQKPYFMSNELKSVLIKKNAETPGH